MSRKHQVHDTSDDANDDVIYDGDVDAFMDAVNDSQYTPSRSSRAENLQARRRLESLLEERRLKQVIDDDWGLDAEEEEEE
ncbi:PA3496 family putative envelope integrity protein [Halomonas sp. I5-271120]|uniref:PA3496 family putative envelope integrity protein n=1 Tax=Halomonas sp. I5-271120 TaxID=3061632 RepID=UPI0027146C02|nr:hypothetical protein [Halomonas sp. I5-271120]